MSTALPGSNAEITCLAVLHHQPEVVLLIVSSVILHDIGTLALPQNLHLLDAGLEVCPCDRHYLDGHQLPCPLVHALVDVAVRTLSDRLHQVEEVRGVVIDAHQGDDLLDFRVIHVRPHCYYYSAISKQTSAN